MNGTSPELDAKLARISLESLRSAAVELQLDDPEALRRTLAFVQGNMVQLRAYAKRRIAAIEASAAEVAGKKERPAEAGRHSHQEG